MKNKGLSPSEVIVTVWVIALFFSAIMPTLGAAQRAARIVKCKTNLKQLVIAFVTYCCANDNKSVVGLGGTEYWPMQMAPYLGDEKILKYDHINSPYVLTDQDVDVEKAIPNTMAVLRCPSTKAPICDHYKGNGGGGCAGTAIHRYRYHGVNVPGAYGINSWAGGWIGSGQSNQQEKRKSYRDTGPTDPEVPLFTDAVWIGAKPSDTDLTPGYWNNAYSLDTGGMLVNEMGRFVSNRHGRFTNIVYWEGHARTILLGELWNQQWHKEFDKHVEENILAGPNPNNHY